MRVERCRVCGGSLFPEPLLRYEDMPKSAQSLPDKESLSEDRGVTLEICQCSGCGLVQLNSEPVPYYREVIRASGISEEMRIFRRKQFTEWINKYSLAGKKIIEIGCGKGEYLSIMKECGVRVYGLEYSKESMEECLKKDLDVLRGFVEDFDCRLRYAPFEGFFMLSFLEHLPQPCSTLRGISANLAEEAVGLIEVPNFDMILQKRLFSEFIPDHLFYFTQETLNTTLVLSGFEVMESNYLWYDYIISTVVKKRSRLDLSSFKSHKAKIKKDLKSFLDRFKSKSVAIWGAGHQALAIMSLMGLAGKIKYVIDSAPFKQGRYTPVTHIPVVAPEKLHSDPPEAIIVIAGSYSDEVAKIIRERFDKNMNVAILRDYGLQES